jgi:hypothetical protein
VADRWHLLANLRDALERFLQRRSAAISELLRDPAPDGTPAPATRSLVTQSGSDRDSRAGASEKRVARSERVRRLRTDGISLRGIARALDLHHQAVERYVRSDTCPDWQPGRHRPSLLDRYEGLVPERFEGGCRNSSRIHRELQGSGCRCGKTVVKDYIRRLKAEGHGRPRRIATPSVGSVPR